MKHFISALYLAALVATVCPHEHPNHADQIPLDYVRFPVDPLYRSAKGEGTYTMLCKDLIILTSLAYLSSYRRCHFFWYHNVRPTSLGAMSYSGTACTL